MNAEAWVALYAAVVATGALFLEVRRWFEGGPRIYVKASPNMTMFNHMEETTGLLVVNVANRGDVPTTITHFGIHQYPTLWKRFTGKPSRTFIIPNPQPEGTPPIIPAVLRPGERWMGMAHPRPEITGDIETGTFWAAIYTTDRDKPYLAHVAKRKDPVLKNATVV